MIMTGDDWTNEEDHVGESKRPFTLPEILDTLEATPARIGAAVSGLSVDELVEPLPPGSWSARDIVGHLRACDLTWGGYLVRILDEAQPSFRPESPRTTIRHTDFLSIPFAASLQAFTVDRVRLMGRLRAIEPQMLDRTAVVTLYGGGQEERTAAFYANNLAVHEREHVLKLDRMMARWRAERADPGGRTEDRPT
jgi:hypothetical protein